MESSFKKPASRMVKPRNPPPPTSEEAVDAKEMQEAFDAEQKRQAKAKESEDKIGALIGGAWWIQNWTAPCLAHPVLPQMTVTRFYPDAFVAVDIFTHVADWERKIIAYKREQFKNNEVEHGGKKGKVRYGALSYADPLAALLPQLEE